MDSRKFEQDLKSFLDSMLDKELKGKEYEILLARIIKIFAKERLKLLKMDIVQEGHLTIVKTRDMIDYN